MNTGEIRNTFLDYFAGNGHQLVESSSLIPKNDKSLLFTNAGMVQFKEIFLGLTPSPYPSAVSSQRCVRAGGKHNDLDNVGFTGRHHTFFEMLGNFSFGQYFKEEAITYSWELLTEVFGIRKERLWVTVLEGDDEAADIWIKKIGVEKNHLVYCGKTDNFWMMGDTGPCGPCSEIFYDHGPSINGGPPGSVDADGDRFVEIWNLVFMQYEMSSGGKMEAIPVPCVDTGMGLERIAAVLQGVTSNYDIDLFSNLLSAVSKLFPGRDGAVGSSKVIADHIRSASFLIADGIFPSNEGRGYVLRRIIRRALRHGHKLGNSGLFFHRLADTLVAEMGDAYSILVDKADLISNTLKEEEERFLETLDNGMKMLVNHIKKNSEGQIDGDVAFRLYDTYGFPLDLTADVAREHDLELDLQGFEKAMEKQKSMGRKANQFGQLDSESGIPAEILPDQGDRKVFVGYETLCDESSVEAIYLKTEKKGSISEGESAVLVLDQTPFYGESGGQVGDRGQLIGPKGTFEVYDTQLYLGRYLHSGKQVSGQIRQHDAVIAEVEPDVRRKTCANHSATHLLHAALRSVLGDHIEQKGSHVDSTRLRFDFSHNRALMSTEIREVEQIINSEIRANHKIETKLTTFDSAIKDGATALFDEKYGEEVRVLSMGCFSIELCGGTHADRTGDLGIVKIVSQTSVGSGIRRIEAVSGEVAEEFINKSQRILETVGEMVKGSSDKLEEKVSSLLDAKNKLEKDVAHFKQKAAGETQVDIQEAITVIGDVKVVSELLKNATIDILRNTCDGLKDKHERIVVVLGSVDEDKVRLVSGVTKDLTDRINAVDLINAVAVQVDGKGGGRPDLAQAGGANPDKLLDALRSVPQWVVDRIE